MSTKLRMPNIDLNPNDWEEVKYILRTHLPEYEIWAFGSRVSWTAKAYSDLDLAIITSQPLPLTRFAEVREAFDESTLSIKVDLVDWAATIESFRLIIKKGKVILQAPNTALTGWEFKRLIDCTSDRTISYGIVQPGRLDPNGIPIIRVNNFNKGRLQLEDVFKVSPEIEKKYLRTRLFGREVLLTLVGSTGQSAVVPKEMAGWNIARAVAVIRPREEIGADWINICLQTKDVQRFLDERANTTVQKTLNLADVREIPIPIPPKPIKRQIETIMLALTNKIELNRQINQTLEEMAQAIFKSWFVDFDPVKAKIEARANGHDPERAAMCAISGKTDVQLDHLAPDQLDQLRATAVLFPDELIDSELRPIPKGWEETNLGEITIELRRGVSPKYVEKGGVKVVNQKCIRNHTIDFSLCRCNDPAKRKINGRELQIGDILVNSTGVGTLGRLSPVRYLPEETTVADSHVTVVRGDKERVTASYLASFILTKESFIESSGAGSTGQTELRRQVLEDIELCLPSYNIQEAFEKVGKPIHDIITKNEQQKSTLSQLRDALLPKLFSGEISVNGTGSIIQEEA